MLGNNTLQNYFKNSNIIDIRPMATLEFNGNDYGYPYLYGTSTAPSSSYSGNLLTLSPVSPAPSATNVNRGIETAINPNPNAQLINVLGDSNLSVASNTVFSYTADAPAGQKYVKFHMFLKSDYKYQSLTSEIIQETFNVVVTASGLDINNKLVRSEIVTENLEVNSVDWQSVTLLFANPDEDVNKVRLTIYISPSSKMRASLLVSQLSYSSISDYEVYVKNRLSVGEVFETLRPGEFMVDMPPANRPDISVGNESYPQQCSPVHIAMNYALGPKYENVQRSVTPFKGNPYSYYVSGSIAESKKVWTLYKNKIKTNKIVLKTNSLAFSPDAISIRLLASDGWSQNIVPSQISVDEHGILVLYYSGQSWTATPWGREDYPYIEDSQTSNNIGNIMIAGQVGYKEIFGIEFSANSIEIVNQDFSDFGTSNLRLELIELSPRLEVDVTKFIESVSSNQELSEDNNLLTIGGITSNSLELSLSNIPILNVLTNDKSIPISNMSSSSYFNNVLRKNVKGKISFKVDSTNIVGDSGTIEYLPHFTGYLESWQESDYELSLQFYDAIKILQSTRSRPIYLRGKKVNSIISAVFDTVGFGEAYAEELRKLRAIGKSNNSDSFMENNDIVPHFWTVSERSVSETLMDLTKVFQITLYSDPYGGIKADSLYTFNNKYLNLTSDVNPTTPDFYIQDFSNNNSSSNLISASMSEFAKPEALVVRYITPVPSIGQSADVNQYSNRIIKRPFGKDEVWVLDGVDGVLPYIQIANEGIKNAAQQYIPYYPSLTRIVPRALSYSSYLLIDDEILSYEGLEYEFSYKKNGIQQKIIRCIKSRDEIENVMSEIFSEFQGYSITYRETGRLLNVKRGLFGTPASAHVRTGPESITNWRMLKFTKSSNSLTNGTNVPRKTGKWSETINGIQVTANSDNEVLFLYPSDDQDDSALLKNKKRMATQFYLGDIPKNKEGYLGVGIGLVTDNNNKLKNGLLIWCGVEPGKKKQQPNIYVQEINPDGTLKTLVSKENFEYAEDLLEEKDNVEVFVSLSKDRNRCEVLIGGTSIFKKTIKKKVNGKKKKIRQTAFPIRQLPRVGKFGFLTSGFGIGVLGQMQFGVSKNPEDLNDLSISDIDDDYQGHITKVPNRTFFIGGNTLLDNIVYGQNIAGITDSSGDNFVYTGAPVGRGIRIFDVDYDSYPVISPIETVWNGYTYEISAFEEGNLISIREPDDIG